MRDEGEFHSPAFQVKLPKRGFALKERESPAQGIAARAAHPGLEEDHGFLTTVSVHITPPRSRGRSPPRRVGVRKKTSL